MSIRDVVRFCYDTDTIVLRIIIGIGWIRLESYEYRQYSITIYQCILGNTARKLGMKYELVKNTLKAFTNPIRIKGNS